MTEIISYRYAIADDAHELHDLFIICFKELSYTEHKIIGIINDKYSSSMILAIYNGKIVGFSSTCNYMYVYPVISSIGVHPDFRKRGIASTLLNASECIASQYSDTIGLQVETNNASAIRLYEKMGYIVIQMKLNYYHLGCHAYEMIKTPESKMVECIKQINENFPILQNEPALYSYINCKIQIINEEEKVFIEKKITGNSELITTIYKYN